MSYQSPICPDEDRACYLCIHRDYDTHHDESWCRYHLHLIDGGGTCELFESWEEAEKKKIKQLFLFK